MVLRVLRLTHGVSHTAFAVCVLIGAAKCLSLLAMKVSYYRDKQDLILERSQMQWQGILD